MILNLGVEGSIVGASLNPPDAWMDGWMDGWMDAWMDGRVDEMMFGDTRLSGLVLGKSCIIE